MNFLKGSTGAWWVFFIVAIFLIIGGIVFYLRKNIPGIAEYEEEDEEKIAQDNLSRILVSVEEEKKQEEKLKELEDDKKDE